MLKFAGLVLLVALILVGALMPLKYTARMRLPKLPGTKATDGRDRAAPAHAADGDDPR